MSTTKAEQARGYFDQGYNCAQAVAAAFAPEMGMDEPTALRLASSFGGGMAGLRGMCGAVSGMFLVMGLLEGYDRPDDPTAKQQHYKRMRDMAAQMEAEHGTLICAELLKRNSILPKPAPSQRDEAYYAKRPCARYVETCAALVEEELKNRQE